MPKLLFAAGCARCREERQLPKLAGADMLRGIGSCGRGWWRPAGTGCRSRRSRDRLGCRPETVRRRLHRFSAESIDGLGESLSADVAGQLALARNTRSSGKLIIRDFTGLSTCSAGFHCRAPISACRYRPAPKFLPRLC